MLRLFPKMRVSIVFSIEFVVFVVLFTWLMVVRVFCSQPFPFGFFLPSTSDGQTFFIRVYRTEHRRLLRAQHVESSIGITFPRAGKWYFRLLSRGNRHGHDRDVLSLCSWFTLQQRRRVWVCKMLHRALLSMELLYVVAPFAILATSWFFCGWCIRYKILPSIYAPLLEPFTLVLCRVSLWLLV